MVKKYSDINSRLPRYREIMASVEDIGKAGGLEGVSQQVLDYVHASEPVGVDEDGEVVMPPGHDPSKSPVFLPLQLREDKEMSCPIGGEADLGLVKRLLEQALNKNVHFSDPRRFAESYKQKIDLPSRAHVTNAMVPIPPYETNAAEQHYIKVPRVIVVRGRDKVSGRLQGLAAVHEVDHWDFMVNESGVLQSHPEARYSEERFRAVMEKRAYLTQYKVEANLGHYAKEGVARLVELHTDTKPGDIFSMVEDIESLKVVNAQPKDCTDTALAVFVASRLFGQPDTLVSDQEVEAFRTLGVLE